MHRNISMYPYNDILEIARQQPFMLEQLQLLQEKEQQIPGSVRYTIKRFKKDPQVSIDDVAMINYHVQPGNTGENKLELKFCISGNTYCRQKDIECNFCQHGASNHCGEKVDSIDLLHFTYTPSHLSQFVRGKKQSTLSDNILNFKHTVSFSKLVPLCGKTRDVLDALLNHSYSDSLENIYINAQTQMLLLYSMDCMIGDTVEEFSCKFLANEADRKKIIEARRILLEHIGEPLTIKALSRKVAINECYLKQGFKEMFGTTIFDFFQSQRMEHAKYLLYEKGLSVTEFYQCSAIRASPISLLRLKNRPG